MRVIYIPHPILNMPQVNIRHNHEAHFTIITAYHGVYERDWRDEVSAVRDTLMSQVDLFSHRRHYSF